MKKPVCLTFYLCLTFILEKVFTIIVPNIVKINMQSTISSFQWFFFQIRIFHPKIRLCALSRVFRFYHTIVYGVWNMLHHKTFMLQFLWCLTPKLAILTGLNGHAWFHLHGFRWPVRNGEGAKNSKWKYMSPAGLEPTPRQSTTGKSAS